MSPVVHYAKLVHLSLAELSRTTGWLDGARLVASRGDQLDVDPHDLELQRQFEEERRDKAA